MIASVNLSKRFWTIGSIIYFILFTLSLLFIRNSSIGYEVSIYQSTHALYWFSLIFGYIIGTIFLLKRTDLVNVGKIILSLNAISLISLYIIKGHLAYNIGGDVGTHVHHLYQLIETGVTSSHYPGRYIYSSILCNCSGIEQIHIQNITGVIGIIVFLMGYICVSRLLYSDSPSQNITYLLLSFVPFGSTVIMTAGFPLFFYVPYLFGLFLFPIFIYIVLLFVSEKYLDTRYILLGIFYYVVLTISHPIIGLVGLVFLFSIFIGKVCCTHRNKKEDRKISIYSIKWISTMFLISLIIYLLWIYQSGDLQHPVQSFLEIFEYDAVSAADLYVARSSDSLVFASLISTLEFIARQAGLLIILGFLAGMGIISTVYEYISHKIDQHHYINREVFILLCIFLLFYLGMIGFVFIMGMSFGPGRLTAILTGVLVLFSTITIRRLVVKCNLSKSFVIRLVSLLFVLIFIVSISICGVLSFYPSSSVTYQPSQQTTNADLSGFTYYINYYNPSYQEYGVDNVELKRYAYSIFKSDYIRTNNYYDTHYTYKQMAYPPNHFGYDNATSIDIKETQSYLIILMYVIEKYSNNKYWMGAEKWTYSDVGQLEHDSSVNKLYSNPQVNIYFINHLSNNK